MTDPDMYERFSLENFPECFKEYADLLDWYQYWHTTLDTSDAPCWKWFVGGKINASYNCVDRHLPAAQKQSGPHLCAGTGRRTARRHYLSGAVRAGERDGGAAAETLPASRAGDRVTIHMPMVPELPVTMLACARLGAIHSVVFGGFSGQSCGERIADSGSRVLITMDGYYRSGALLDHKEKADAAVQTAARGRPDG